jgi:hypothetical protein
MGIKQKDAGGLAAYNLSAWSELALGHMKTMLLQ